MFRHFTQEPNSILREYMHTPSKFTSERNADKKKAKAENNDNTKQGKGPVRGGVGTHGGGPPWSHGG